MFCWRAGLVFCLLLPPCAAGPVAAGQIAQANAGLTGRVQDATGAIIPGATVELTQGSGPVLRSVKTDGAGRFQMVQPAAGSYVLHVALAGFEPLTRAVKVAPFTAPVVLTMKLASVSTSISVDAGQDEDVATPEHNQDAASISSDDMKSLPIFDGDVVATISAFLDQSVMGETGPTLMLDGVVSKSVGVAPSAIERVSINQDPYNAMYYTPGRGQIELTTKSTADHFHGSASFTFRDAALNGTNYFATVKPPDQRRIYEGYLTGPMPLLSKAAFLFSITRKEEDAFNAVLAVPALGTPAVNVPAPSRSTALTMKVSRQYGEHHTGFLLYRFYDGSRVNQGTGGLTLASAGYRQTALEQDITYHDELTLGSYKLNQFSFLYERNIDNTISDVQLPKIVIQGVATLGGAQQDTVHTEYNPNLSDIFSWSMGGSSHSRHQVKFGVQMPNMGRHVYEDRTNAQGTYTFASLTPTSSSLAPTSSSLAAYQSGTPTTLTLQAGKMKIFSLYLQPGAFIQDQIQVTPELTVTAGLRYDWQNALPGTTNAFQPRLSLAYVLDRKHAMVFRTGGGLYVRRVGPDVTQRVDRYEHEYEENLLINNPGCYSSTSVCTTAGALPNLFNYQPNLKSPDQFYFSASLERQVTKKSTLTIGYNGFRGWHALRSVDVNAPLPPYPNTVRPNPAFAQILQLNSGANQKSDDMAVSYRGRIGSVVSGFLQYDWQHADSDTEYSGFTPANMYAPNAEWSRAATDVRHRIALFGTLFPDKALNLGVGFYANTGYPYTETTGLDSNDPGLFNARPYGVPRNSLTATGYQDIQLRLGYNWKVHRHQKDATPVVGLSVASFNTLNRVNYNGFVGVLGPNFGRPTSANDPRRIQMQVSYTF